MPALGKFARFAPPWLMAATAAVSVGSAGAAAGCMMLGGLIVATVERGRAPWPARPVMLSLAALLAAYALATLLSRPYPTHWHKFAEESWIKLLLLAVPLLAGRDPARVERMMKLVVIMGAATAVYACVQHFTGIDAVRGRSLYRPEFGHVAVTGFYGHHLTYGGHVLIVLTLAVAWALDHDATGRRWLPLLIAVVAAALLWSYARSVWLGVAAGMLALMIMTGRRARLLMLPGMAAAVVALATPLLRSHALGILDLERHATRLNLWTSSLRGIAANPLTGVGPGNFGAMMDRYMTPGHYDLHGHAHHDLLMHGVNAGLPAVAAALALLVTICVVLLRAARRPGPGRWVLIGGVAVQVGITVAGFFQVFQTDDEVELLLYFVLGCALALAAARERADHRAASTSS